MGGKEKEEAQGFGDRATPRTHACSMQQACHPAHAYHASVMSKWLTIALCVLGLALAGYVVATSNQKIPDQPPAATPTVNPFADGIAASGTIEAASRNLAINAPAGGLVMEVLAN